MSERYPDDVTLLSLVEDSVTGVEYIPTGRGPYFLEFRKLVQRALLSMGRANDLRVYQEGDLAVGVRAGRFFIRNAAVEFFGASGVSIASNATTSLWIDAVGTLQTSTTGLPADRTGFVPLAEVVAGTSTIASIADLRGEAFLQIADLASMGVTASASEMNQSLSGISLTVDSDALNRLTSGPESTADSEHRHLQVFQDQDSEAYFYLTNNHSGVNANSALVFSLPNKLSSDTSLLLNLSNGFLSQRSGVATYNLVGSVHAQFTHEGTLSTDQVGKLVGAVPVDGVVSDIVLSLDQNIESGIASDAISLLVRVNSNSVTITDPSIDSGSGTGFRSTARGDGVAAVIKSDGVENVQRGDILTVDLIRSAGGSVTAEAAGVVVMVVIRVDGPE